MVGLSNDLIEILQHYLLFKNYRRVLSCEVNLILNNNGNELVFMRSFKFEDVAVALSHKQKDASVVVKRGGLTGVEIFLIRLGSFCGLISICLIVFRSDIMSKTFGRILEF